MGMWIGIPVAALVIVVLFMSLIAMVARNYLKVAPNEVLVLSGRKRTIKDERGVRTVGYRLITGGAAFRWPILEVAQRLSLNLIQVPLKIEDTPNIDGVLIGVEAVANVKIASEESMLTAACERFLNVSQPDIDKIIHDILEGQLRQILGTLTVEEIVKERDKITQSMLHNAAPDLEKIGVRFDIIVINKIWDKMGYIEALGKKRTAEVIRDAQIGQAEAEKEATIKASTAKREGEQIRFENEWKVSQAERDLNLKKAEFNAEVATAQSKAEQAKPLATAKWQQEVKKEEVKVEAVRTNALIEVAEKESQRREKELVATKIKPAEAERLAAIITAEGEATATARRSEGQKIATINIAEAEKMKLTAEGEGKAAAGLALRKAEGEGDATAIRAKGLAEGDALRARGLAEGDAVKAKALAEAEGLLRKNQAMAEMSEAARIIIILEKLPEIIEHGGEALEKTLGPAFQSIGQGLAGIDNVTIVQTGSGDGSSAVTGFANNVPKILFNFLTSAKALGMDFGGLLEKLGIKGGELGLEKAITNKDGSGR